MVLISIVPLYLSSNKLHSVHPCSFSAGAWQKREGSVFEGGGGDTPMHTMKEIDNNFNYDFELLMARSLLLISNKKVPPCN